jgi:antitoxin (DNA-binding transcriptional repressor) of toxin-antitoxin stability system
MQAAPAGHLDGLGAISQSGGIRTTVHAAKTNLSRPVKRTGRGKEVVIARGETPVVRLVPLARQSKGRRFGAMKGKARTGGAFFEALPEAELRLWER